MEVKIEELNIIEPGKELLFDIVKQIKESHVENIEKNYYEGSFQLEIIRDDLHFIIEGFQSCLIEKEPETGFENIRGLEVSIDIFAVFFKEIDVKECNYNDYDIKEQIINAIENQYI